MIIIITCIAFFYVILIAGFVYGFEKINLFKLSNLPSKTTFTVIIPFRNEADNLPKLMDSIKNIQYPKSLFEIIFVNDASDDDSIQIIKKTLPNSLSFLIIDSKNKTNSPKKEAITMALNHSKHEWIITTDADCELPKYWLDSFDEFIQKTEAICVAAPVAYHSKPTFLNKFQTLDMLSLQGATMGGFGINRPFLCNGANFAYKKKAFKAVDGFKGNTHIASGDDIFLLEKMIMRYPKNVFFLKCKQAIVATSPQPTWQQLLAQRIRWAAKTTAYHNWFGKLTGFLVLLMNVLVILCIVLTLVGILKIKILFYLMFIKFNIDALMLYKTASFFNQADVLKSILLGFILYPFFAVYVAFSSLFKGFEWKSRSYKK